MHLQLSDNHYKSVNRMRSFEGRGPTLARRGDLAWNRGPGGRDPRPAEPRGGVGLAARLAHLARAREGTRLSERTGGATQGPRTEGLLPRPAARGRGLAGGPSRRAEARRLRANLAPTAEAFAIVL